MTNHDNPLTALSKAMAEAVEKAGTATVLVDARRRFPASGIAYAADLILTADHVVEKDEDIRVVLPDGSEQAASLAGRDPGNDLALLRLPQASAVPAVPASPARVGQLVLALGRPSTEGLQASLGIVSALGGSLRTRRGGLLERHIRTDAIPYPGFSGGPLIDGQGAVLGMNTSGLGMGASLAIPHEVAWRAAAALAEHGSVKRGFLGVRSQLVDLPSDAQAALKRTQTHGLLVIGVEEDSPASGSLMVGDILVGLNGETIQDHDQLLGLLTGEVVGRPTPVEILRGGKPQTVQVTIGERQEHQHSHRGRRRMFWRGMRP